MTDEEFLKVWRCKKHSNCWGTAHLTTQQVRGEASRCAQDCNCWRHRVVEITQGDKQAGVLYRCKCKTIMRLGRLPKSGRQYASCPSEACGLLSPVPGFAEVLETEEV